MSTLPPFFQRAAFSVFEGSARLPDQFLIDKGGRRARIRENRKIREARGPADRKIKKILQRDPALFFRRDQRPPPLAAGCMPAPGRRSASTRPQPPAAPAPTDHFAGSPGGPAGGMPPAGTARPGWYSAGSIVSGRANCTP
ncbi:hypothetical protein IPC447_29960 [Pseudomonas aeruginosa]|nr:hypothetical protein IPC447_29960 [Pseudomonas aeruginosa]